LAVFDGHGGSKVSQYLQDNIHNTITSVIKNRSKVVRDNETLIKISLHNIFECLEQNLLQIMNS
jgi:serine/threonine protein phosphatase PrpC